MLKTGASANAPVFLCPKLSKASANAYRKRTTRNMITGQIIMRIEQELKLGFKDVLFRPKRSTLKSRSQVELTREFTFKHSGRQWSGVPVIAANMDSVASFEMAAALAEHGVMTAVHKHYTVE